MMVEMELFRIRIDDTRSDQLVILKEKKGKRLLPIVIGVYEADAIRLKVNGTELPRPLTHDLFVNVLGILGVELERIVIHRLLQGTFFARLVLKKYDGTEEEVDSRPSDAIALAVRSGARIFAEEHLLDFTRCNEKAFHTFPCSIPDFRVRDCLRPCCGA